MEAVKEKPPSRVGLQPKGALLNEKGRSAFNDHSHQEGSVPQICTSLPNQAVQEISMVPAAKAMHGASPQPETVLSSDSIVGDKSRSRVNHFLSYPLYINIITANWDKMLDFYEEVLELPVVHHPKEQACGFVAGNLGVFLIKDPGSSKNPQNNLQLMLVTDLTLSRLARKLEMRGIKTERISLNHFNSPCCENGCIPVVQINDPDGNKILIVSSHPEKKEKSQGVE